MKTIFGVSSATPANKRLKNGYTLYDWVMRQKGIPEFWGRQIGGKNGITEEEVKFLKERNCKICLLFDDFNESQISGNYDTGQGWHAAAAAKELGVPQGEGISIYADINPEWSINHNWMLGFATTVVDDGYVAGFIGNTDSKKNFNFDRQSSHYLQSISYKKHLKASFGATEPKCYTEPENWMPYCPSGMTADDIDLWRCGSITFDLLTADVVYAKDDNILEKMW